MGTRINTLFAHSLADWTDREATLEILRAATELDLALDDYWASVGEGTRRQHGDWVADPPFPPPETRDYFRYTSPCQLLFVDVNPHSVRTRTAGRWRGFLSIAPLRRAHLAALRGIARLFDAPEIWYFGDEDFATGAFWDGKPVSDCIHVLSDHAGPPLPLPDELDPTIAAAAEHGVPGVWYHEVLNDD